VSTAATLTAEATRTAVLPTGMRVDRPEVGEPLRVHLVAAPAQVHTDPRMVLHRAGVLLVPGPDWSPDTVILLVSRTVDEALDAVPATHRSDLRRLMIVADTVSADGAMRAVRAGVGALFTSGESTPERLVAALSSVRDGDRRMPHDLLVRLLSGTAGKSLAWIGAPPQLTWRQVTMLRLVADGLDNASIAHDLACSEHTVKNVIYELMNRLRARNRTHAVATAIRTGLI
jgi:DNA-binding NarL/FixJ family response regulator